MSRPFLGNVRTGFRRDRISGGYLDRLTSGQRDAGDSLHLLVMDLHKELNRLQQQLASETINGARVRDPLASHADRIAASKEARKMLGVDAPEKSININANVDPNEPPIQDVLQEILRDPEARLKACEFSEAIGKLRSKQPAGDDAHANATPAAQDTLDRLSEFGGEFSLH